MKGLTEALMSDDLLALSSAGVLLAAGLIVASYVLLPGPERGRVRGPLWLLIGHILFSLPRVAWGRSGWAVDLLELLATLALLLSVGHAAVLLLMDALAARRFDRPPPKIFRDIASGLMYMTAGLLTLRAAGVDAASLLTTSALLTAIIGLSLQDTLGNLFAGLSLQGERPFEVGDWIEFGGEGSTGRVIEINWRATKVRTVEQVELTIPNGQLARSSIFNFSRPTALVRRSVRVVVSREVPTGHVQAVISEALVAVRGMRESPAPSVLTEAFEDHGVRYWVRFFIEEYADRYVIDSAVRDRVWYALNRAGIKPAVPVRHVQVEDAGQDAKAAEAQAERDRRQQALGRVPLLEGIRAQDLTVLADASQRICFGPGETVVRQGDPGDSLFVCVTGDLEVRYSPERGPTQLLGRLGPGGVFGEFSAMTGERRSASVKARSHADLLRLDRQAFEQALAENPRLAEQFSERLAKRRAELGALSGAPEQTADAIRESEALLERIRGFLGMRQPR